MIIHPTGTVGRAVAEYTGKRVVTVEIVPDPRVPGVYAVRAELANDLDHPATRSTLEFLIRGVSLHRVTFDDLEEVAFTEWPPVSDR